MKSLLTLLCMLAAAAAFAVPAKEARIDCLNVGQGTALKVADKGIVHGIGMTHSCFREFYERLGKWLKEDAAAPASGPRDR